MADDSAGTLGDACTLHTTQYLEIVLASGTELWSFLEVYHLGGVVSTEMQN